MMNWQARAVGIVGVIALVSLGACRREGGSNYQKQAAAPTPAAPAAAPPVVVAPEPGKEPQPVKTGDKIVRSDEEWKKMLTPEQYRILREKGTERAFTGKYWDTKTPGVYKCAACGTVLFSSGSKFDSGCGWPSFDAMISAGTVEEYTDTSFGMVRTEVTCAKCGGHLGHVFDDGPTQTGLRYCINSASIELEPDPDDANKEPPKDK